MPRAAEPEIVDEGAIRIERLRADARRPEHDLILANLGDVAAHVGEERAFRDIAPHLSGTHPPEPAREPEEAAIAQDAGQVPRAQVAPTVPLAGEGEHRVGTGPDFAIDALREVHAKEWEARIGNRVDEATNE